MKEKVREGRSELKWIWRKEEVRQKRGIVRRKRLKGRNVEVREGRSGYGGRRKSGRKEERGDSKKEEAG